ncbi:MAG: HD domain-containing protein [Deltaproteobacteria bacterium]|nr:HD domain-containing protein [Deltaproteobacteria bacterium]
MNMVPTIKDIEAFARRSFSDIHGSHDWSHTQRVYKLCMRIGQKEGADLDVLSIAAYLHDVGRAIQDRSNGTVCHAQKGAEIATGLLRNYPLSEDQKANIIHCIQSHRFRGVDKPESLEAKVLFDADKLDSIGAIGIGRAFQFAGEIGAKLHNPLIDPSDSLPYTEEDTGYREFRQKLIKIKDKMMTDEGVRIAKERHEFMVAFFQRFLLEYDCIQ